ncbi:unnamed protein product [Paramecium pentaurelia]|uniref:Uncharacterized protein n=1 Tax=Paramecium pentaurelia TaxID=43138 RepID=A0A8S1SJD7_9CILI|nr:unnamed protein product [Paramecium pentaurelia]
MSQIEMQQFDQDRVPDDEREDDFKNLIAILAGKIQLKTVEPGILGRLDHLENYYDLLPFNVRGFRLINRASLLNGDFSKRYIIKQIIDLNLDLENDFRKHYLIDTAVKMVEGVPTWSFFVSLILLTLFLLQVCLDSMLYNLLVMKHDSVQNEYDNTTGPTANDEQTLHDLKEELIAIWFLYILIPFRLGLWMIDLVIRYIGLRYFRKEYSTLAMFFDFLLGLLTIIIVGFSTRLDYSLRSDTAQTQVELIIRNLVIFLIFLAGMIQSKKAMDLTKRLCLLFNQRKVSCCNFISF